MIQFVCMCAVLHEHSFLGKKCSPRSPGFCVWWGDSNPPRCSVRFHVADWECPLDGSGGCQVIILKPWPWTILGNVLGEYHAHTTLSTSFVDF